MKKAPMIRRALMLAVFSFPLLMLSGCWSSLELNERLFVRMLIVDKAEQGIELTLVFPLPNRLIPGTAEGTGQQEGKVYSYMTQAGADIGQAYRNIQANLTRRINFGQTRVIVVGRELAEEGVEPVLEFIGRNAPFYLNSKIYVTTEKAHDIATIATVSERFPSDVVAAFSRFRFTIDTASKDVMAANYNGGDVVLPLLRVKKIRIETEKEKEQMWVHPVGAAVLKEGRMVGTLTMKEMRGGLWILGKLKDAEITVQSPTDGKDVSFMIRNTHTRTKPKLTRDRILIQIETDADAGVLSSDSNVDLEDPHMLKLVEQSLNREIHRRITGAITKTRSMKTDAFNFSSYIDWTYPRQWERIKPHWREIYAESLAFSVRPDVKIRQIGTIKESVVNTLTPKRRDEK